MTPHLENYGILKSIDKSKCYYLPPGPPTLSSTDSEPGKVK